MKFFVAAFTCLLTSTHAIGAPKSVQNRVVYDFNQGNVMVYGVYSPSPDNNEKKSGLQAELEARKEGVQTVADHLEACTKETKRALTSNWRNSLKSLGSTIFPKGILEIELSAPMREIFQSKTSGVTIPKTTEGEDVAFKLPALPSNAAPCGVARISRDSRTQIHVLPIVVSRSDTKFRIVTLSLAADMSLQPATPADSALLQKSDFGKNAQEKNKGTADSPIAVPVVSASVSSAQ